MSQANLHKTPKPPLKERSCEIWAIGGGKGGTGKSFITSSIGSYLTTKGKSVVLIDADLGGANLHSFLGTKKPKISLSDFFEKKIPLEDIVHVNGHGKMGLVAGNLSSLETDRVKYTQRLKLFRHIKKLNADHVLIDLGAGSHFSTMDTFLLADRMSVVILPEVTSIENMYQFVKSVLFRKLCFSFKAHGLKDLLQNTWKARSDKGIKNMRELIDYMRKVSPHIREVIDSELSNFNINIIVNQARSSEDTELGYSIRSVLMKYLGINSRYAGHIDYDDAVWDCMRKRQPFMESYYSSSSASEIRKLTENLIAGRQAH